MLVSEDKSAETVKTHRRANTGNPALDSYLNSISESKPLSMSEEAELANRIRQGDAQARNQLVEANLRFVVSVAKEYQNRGLAMPELISVGNMGLLTAAERFDETKGFKFITYAVWWVRQSIRQALMDQSTVRVPINRLDMMNKVSRTCDDLEQRAGMTSSEEVAKVLGFSKEKVDQLRATPQSLCCSLDAPIDAQEEASMIDQLEDQGQSTPEELLLDHSQRENIDIVLASLADREAQIIKLYFGFDNGEPMTLEQIGQRFDLTRERVRQIKERALTKLRRPSVFSRLS